MLPDELIAKVIQHLDLEDLVALSYTNTQWRDSIPESLYETKLRRHCPSFLPNNTSRKTWQECARVHVARLKDPNLKKNLEAHLRGGARVTVNVQKNTPPPKGFVSFLNAVERYELRESHTLIRVFPGYSARIWGEHSLRFYADKKITMDDLTTKSGTNLHLSYLGNSDVNETRVVKSQHSIALTTSTSHGTRDAEEGTCQVAFRLSSKNSTLVYSATDRNNQGRIYPFVGDKCASAACYREIDPPEEEDEEEEDEDERVLDGPLDYYRPKAYVEPRAQMSFMTVQRDKIEHFEHTLDLNCRVNSEDTSDGIFGWWDGLLIEVEYESTNGATVNAHFYDLERKIHTHHRGIWCGGSLRGPWRSLDGRYIYFCDFHWEVRTVWDLQTNIQHYIEPEDRDYFTLVGLLDGKLTVYTYDREYMTEIIPEVNTIDKRHPRTRMDMKEEDDENDERSIFQKAYVPKK